MLPSLFFSFFFNFQLKDSKNTARKNKRNLKTNRYEITGAESFEKIHKKQKLNLEKDAEDLLLPSEEHQNSPEDNGKIHRDFQFF